MKKLIRIIAMTLVFASMFSTAFCTAHAAGLVTAQSIVDPNGKSRAERDMERIKATYDALVCKAYNTYEYMKVPTLDSMPLEGTVKYVMGKHGMGADYYDEPNGETLGTIKEGAKVRAYVFSGDYAFVDAEDGPVGWCKSAYLYKSFSQEFSCINLWNYQGSFGH